MALSQALHELLPFQDLIKDIVQWFGLDPSKIQFTTKSTVFEDNAGALELAKTPKLRPRTKHINVKYHHFRSAVHAGDITVESVSSKLLEQLADIFTKPLGDKEFVEIREKINGY